MRAKGPLEAFRRSDRWLERPAQDGLDRFASVGGVCFRHRPSVTIPIWRVVRLHAIGESIPGHDVSGTGWQTLGGAMQSITTMMPM
jgi:hypothetical protein